MEHFIIYKNKLLWPTYDSNHVKNIALLGHAGCGKTTLAESMLFEAGITKRRGTIAAKKYRKRLPRTGNRKTKFSVFASLLHTPWKDYKINIIDTPGYDDFVGEVISALRVADTGVMILNAAVGVEVGTDIIWEYTDTFKTPTLFVVNQLDTDDADFDKTLREAKTHFGGNVVAVQYPVQTGAGFNSIIDVLNMVMYQYRPRGWQATKNCLYPIMKKKKQINCIKN